MPRVLLLFTVVCLFGAWVSWSEVNALGARQATWQLVSAHVVTSRIVQRARSSTRRGWGGHAYDGLDFEYAYQTPAGRFVASRVHGWYTLENAEARGVAREFPAGSWVRAYYDPAQPAEAVALPSARHDTWGTVRFLALAAVLFELSFMWVMSGR